MTFDDIYSKKIWEYNGTLSGAGSVHSGVTEYITFLKKFKHRNVLDIGCGDCKIYNDTPIFNNHIGIDLVDIEKYSKIPTFIKFYNTSIFDFDFNNVNFDLIIIKDVFQHLSTTSCICILEKIYDKKQVQCLITNDFNTEKENLDCLDAEFRPLNLRTAPFNLNPTFSFKWESKIDKRMKETILI